MSNQIKIILVNLVILLASLEVSAQIGFLKQLGQPSVPDYPIKAEENQDSTISIYAGRVDIVPNPPSPPVNPYYSLFHTYKLDKNGSFISETRIDTPNFSMQVNDVVRKNNSIYIVGILDTLLNTNIYYHKLFIAKSNKQGAIQWSITVGDTLSNYEATKLLVDDEYIYVLGLGDTNYNVQFTKLDTNGNIEYNQNIDAPTMFGKSPKGILKLYDSTFILAGYGNFSSSSQDKWMIRIKENGDTLFAKTITMSNSGWVTNIAHAYDSTFYTLGNSLTRFDYNGSQLADYSFTQMPQIYSMKKTKDYNYILGGISGLDFSLMKIDTFGNPIWSYSYDNNNTSDGCYNVIECMDGGYILTGYTKKNSDPSQTLVIKVNSMGKLIYAAGINPLEKDKNQISIYPNPIVNNINIKTEAQLKSVEIYNMQGQVIKIGYNKNMDLSHLPPQTYLIHIITDKGFLKTKIQKK